MTAPVSSQRVEYARGPRSWFHSHIHGNEKPGIFLLGLAWVYTRVVEFRQVAYAKNWLKSTRVAVPVIVVGNISVGGTGKSPIVRAIVAELARRGLRPGIVARGYRGTSRHWPRQVFNDSDPVEVGDEAVEHALLADAVGVMVGPSRVLTANALMDLCECNVIVADDGLQHLALRRDIDIAVIDGNAGFGNGHCLPAGPLREPVSALNRVDYVLVNSSNQQDSVTADSLPWSGYRWTSHIVADDIVAADGRDLSIAVDDLNLGEIVSVSGIGNPHRFESMLRAMGIKLSASRRFADHHDFRPEDLEGDAGVSFVMTLKDAVKCRRWFSQYPDIASRCWYVSAHAELDSEFLEQLSSSVEQLCENRAKDK